MTMIGEKSKARLVPSGNMSRTLLRTGSVISFMSRTIWLYGSGFTHESKAFIIIIHMYTVRIVL